MHLYVRRPKNASFQQDVALIRTARSAEILWKHPPVVYEAIERRVVDSRAWAPTWMPRLGLEWLHRRLT